MPYSLTSYEDAFEHTLPMKEEGAKYNRERAERENWTEEEKFAVELIELGDGVRYLWHTREEVAQAYWERHQRGETTTALLKSLKNGMKETYERGQHAERTIKEMGRAVDHVLLITTPPSKILYDREGIKITESTMREIFRCYFRGTSLEDVNYRWNEILDPGYIEDFVKLYQADFLEVIQKWSELQRRIQNSVDSYVDTRRKEVERALEEIKIRAWVLTHGVRKLKKGITNPVRAVFAYKVEKGETMPILTELAGRVNNFFNTGLTPFDLIIWFAVCLIFLIILGKMIIVRRRLRRVGRQTLQLATQHH